MAQRAARIVRDDDVMDGEPRIEGRRVTVQRIQELVEERGLPVAEVAAMHELDVADVYAALTYYYEHPEEMEAIRQQRQERGRKVRDAGAKTIGELKAEHVETEQDDWESTWMTYRILVDENVDPQTADLLRDQAYEAVHAEETLRKGAEHPPIIEYARENDYLILTNDTDFLRPERRQGVSVLYCPANAM